MEQLTIVGPEERLLVNILGQIIVVAKGVEMPPMTLYLVMFESSTLGKKMLPQRRPVAEAGLVPGYQQGVQVVLHAVSCRNTVRRYSLLRHVNWTDQSILTTAWLRL